MATPPHHEPPTSASGPRCGGGGANLSTPATNSTKTNFYLNPNAYCEKMEPQSTWRCAPPGNDENVRVIRYASTRRSVKARRPNLSGAYFKPAPQSGPDIRRT